VYAVNNTFIARMKWGNEHTNFAFNIVLSYNLTYCPFWRNPWVYEQRMDVVY